MRHYLPCREYCTFWDGPHRQPEPFVITPEEQERRRNAAIVGNIMMGVSVDSVNNYTR